MLVPIEKIDLAKQKYDGQAIEEIVEYFGLNYNEKTKAASCPFHEDNTPSFIWNEKSNNFHCFGEETEVITKEGVLPISKIKNRPVQIINGKGEWEEVVFKSYGIQKLLKVNLTSNAKQKIIFATPEHEWIVRDKKYKIQTKDLKPNYKLAKAIIKENILINEILDWKVVSVEETDREEEVYCCVTSTHSFVLKDFILTGNCFGCNVNFGIIDLYMEQGLSYLEAVQKLFEKTGIEYNFGEKGLASKSSYVYPKREEEHDMTQVIEYWGKRGISEKTLKYADIQADKFGNTVFNYYNDSDVLMNVKYRPSHKIKKGEPKCWFQKGTGFTPVLFNMNKCDPSKPLFIQEGEGDCLSVIEAGYTNVVSVPNGSQNMQWIEENWDWLEQFPKIIIWSDNDEPGIKMRKEAIHRLGSWRTYYIEITDHVPDEYTEKHPELKGKLIKDANELLFYYGKDKVLSYLNNPLELPIENVTDLSTAEDFDIDSAEGLYTGIKDLDNQIYKLVFGTVNIITGKSGEGKSVFVNQIAICQALQQGYDVFVFSGELPTPHLKNWVETNMIGRENIEMRNGHVRVFDTEAKKKMREWYSGRVMVYDDSYDTTAKSLLIKMEEMARKFGTKVFLIDNLMMVDLECSEEGRLQAEKDFVKSLIFFAKKFNVLVFLVAHSRKIGGEIRVTKEDIAGSSNIVNLAHMVFSVHRYTEKEKEGEVNNKGDYLKGHEPKEYDSVVEVLKNRITGLLPECELYFDYNSYRFYRTPEELWMRYKWNTDTTPLNKTDPNKEKRKGLSPL